MADNGSLFTGAMKPYISGQLGHKSPKDLRTISLKVLVSTSCVPNTSEICVGGDDGTCIACKWAWVVEMSKKLRAKD